MKYGRKLTKLKGLAENNVKQRYQSLVAPIQGVVFDIKPKIVGYAAQATETILKIVPESELEARIEIPSEDIGFVKDGMSVEISRFLPFNRFWGHFRIHK